MNPPFIFLASGKIHYVDPTGATHPVESRYAADLMAKALKAQERHGWKALEKAGGFLSGPSLWGKAEQEPLAITFTSIAAGRAGEFLYTLRTDHLCAICSIRGEAAEEQRLWNHQSKRLAHLHTHPKTGQIVCSAEKANGSAHIAIRFPEDGAMSEVTEGDSVDTAPAWVPGDKVGIVFQSAGVGRTKDGHFWGIGPFSIQSLEVDSGELTTLAEGAEFDYLTPRIQADGTLYCIKRPYTGRAEPTFLDHVKDFFCLPFRLAYAVFGFLNLFSMLYGGKQLKTVKTANAKKVNLPQMVLWGNLLKAQQPDENNAEAGYAPKSWELIRKRTGGVEEVVAGGVLCFDVAGDGTLLFSNGKEITEWTEGGKKRVVAKGDFVQQVAFLQAGAGTA
jgi:hypothetical protein